MSKNTLEGPRHGIGYAGAVLVSQVNRVVREVERLGDAKDEFLAALSQTASDADETQQEVRHDQ